MLRGYQKEIIGVDGAKKKFHFNSCISLKKGKNRKVSKNTLTKSRHFDLCYAEKE